VDYPSNFRIDITLSLVEWLILLGSL